MLRVIWGEGGGGWSVMGGGADLLLIFCDVVTNSSI